MSKSGGKARSKVSYCRKCDGTDMTKVSGTFHDQGVAMSINRRMIETWYVYKALTKLVEAGIDVDDDHDTSTIRLIKQGRFHLSKE